jgi:YebC/PmpR family DNA-binding regulatory protein
MLKKDDKIVPSRMAGHSKSKTIAHRKGAQDKKRAETFTKLTRAISAAARNGTDPESNYALRSILVRARAAGVPKDRILAAINPTTDRHDEEVVYEAYAPGGVGLMIECLTDNRNRTASDVRAILTKHEAKLQSVQHLFDHVGCLQVSQKTMDQILIGAEQGFGRLLELAERTEEDPPRMYFAKESYAEVQGIVEGLGDEEMVLGLCWLPHIKLGECPESIERLVDELECNDDVQSVWVNC